MDLFNYENYRDIVADQVRSRGRGAWGRLAEHLRLHPSHISQVFKGVRELSEEQALKVAQHFAFSSLQIRFFLLLVKRERAGTEDLRRFYMAELEKLRSLNKQVSAQIESKEELTATQRAYFYSSWINSAIRLLASKSGGTTRAQLSSALKLSGIRIEIFLEKLLELGLVSEKSDRIHTTTKRTHIPASDPQVGVHHRNWRTQTAARLDDLRDHELAFTGPMMVAQKDMAAVRQEILSCLSRINAIVDKSGSDTMACLTIDFTEVGM